MCGCDRQVRQLMGEPMGGAASGTSGGGGKPLSFGPR